MQASGILEWWAGFASRNTVPEIDLPLKPANVKENVIIIFIVWLVGGGTAVLCSLLEIKHLIVRSLKWVYAYVVLSVQKLFKVSMVIATKIAKSVSLVRYRKHDNA